MRARDYECELVRLHKFLKQGGVVVSPVFSQLSGGATRVRDWDGCVGIKDLVLRRSSGRMYLSGSDAHSVRVDTEHNMVSEVAE